MVYKNDIKMISKMMVYKDSLKIHLRDDGLKMTLRMMV